MAKRARAGLAFTDLVVGRPYVFTVNHGGLESSVQGTLQFKSVMVLGVATKKGLVELSRWGPRVEEV